MSEHLAKSGVRRVLVISGLLLSLLAGVAAAQASGDRPFLVQTAGNVDRNLFPLYVLGKLYDDMPGAKATPQAQADWIATTRAEAWRMRSVIRDQQLDPALDPLFQDCLNFTSAYENFLRQRGQIQAERDQRALGDFLGSLFHAMDDGSDAEDVARGLGASNDSASNIGGIAALISGLSEYNSRSQRSDSAANAALQAAAGRLSDSWQQTGSDLSVTSAILARRYGWSLQETGFSGAASDSAERDVWLMPRNPFALAAAATNFGGSETPDALMRRANRCFQAAELVPAGGAYDEYRQLFLFQAASLTVLATSSEAGEHGYSAAPLPSAAYTVQMVRTYLAASPSDPRGIGNLMLARALGWSGRYYDAVAADNVAFEIDPSNRNNSLTAYRYAKLLSLTRQVDSSAQWLQKAYADGFTAIGVARRDPDLANLRQMRPQLFAQLTTARLSNPQFIWGAFLDDAVVRNNSAFDLTNVVVKVAVHKGGALYQFTMACGTVKAGDVCRRNNVVSVPGDSYDYVQATYTSDQGI